MCSQFSNKNLASDIVSSDFRHFSAMMNESKLTNFQQRKLQESVRGQIVYTELLFC